MTYNVFARTLNLTQSNSRTALNIESNGAPPLLSIGGKGSQH